MAGAFSLSPELHRCQRIASLDARWHPCWWHLRIACRKNTVSVHKQCDLTAFSSDALLNVFTSVSCFQPWRSEAVLVCQKSRPELQQKTGRFTPGRKVLLPNSCSTRPDSFTRVLRIKSARLFGKKVAVFQIFSHCQAMLFPWKLLVCIDWDVSQSMQPEITTVELIRFSRTFVVPRR